jgi:hypothetical protein
MDILVELLKLPIIWILIFMVGGLIFLVRHFRHRQVYQPKYVKPSKILSQQKHLGPRDVRKDVSKRTVDDSVLLDELLDD